MLTRILAAYGLYHILLLSRGSQRIATGATNFLRERAPVISWLMDLRKAVPDVTPDEVEYAKHMKMSFEKVAIMPEDTARFLKARKLNLHVGYTGPGGSVPTWDNHFGFTFHNPETSSADNIEPVRHTPDPVKSAVPPAMQDAAVARIILEASRGTSVTDAAKSAAETMKSEAQEIINRAIDASGNLVDMVKGKIDDVKEIAEDGTEKAQELWEANKDGLKSNTKEAWDNVLGHFKDLIGDAGASVEKVREAIRSYDPSQHVGFEQYVWNKVLPGVYFGRKVKPMVAPPASGK